MKNITRLTTEQEIALLKVLGGNDSDDNGAGRMVKIIENNDMLRLCGIPMDYTKVVVKIALGIEGMNQNKVETEAYENYGDRFSLAPILYKGQFVEIMQYVTPLDGEIGREYDSYDSADEFAEDHYDGDDSPYDYSQLMDIYDTAYELERINGRTSDNGQLGYTEDGRLLAYDYGYVSDSDVGFCSNINPNCILMDDYCGELINLLVEGESTRGRIAEALARFE